MVDEFPVQVDCITLMPSSMLNGPRCQGLFIGQFSHVQEFPIFLVEFKGRITLVKQDTAWPYRCIHQDDGQPRCN